MGDTCESMIELVEISEPVGYLSKGQGKTLVSGSGRKEALRLMGEDGTGLTKYTSNLP